MLHHVACALQGRLSLKFSANRGLKEQQVLGTGGPAVLSAQLFLRLTRSVLGLSTFWGCPLRGTHVVWCILLGC